MADEEKNQAEEKKITVADPLAGAVGEEEKLSALPDGQTLKTIKIKAPEKPDEHARNAAILKDVAGSLEKANVVDTSDAKATGRLSAVKPANAKATAKVGIAAKESVDAKATVKLSAPAEKADDKATVKLQRPDAAPSDGEKATVKLPRPEASTDTVKISKPKSAATPIEVADNKDPKAAKAAQTAESSYSFEPEQKSSAPIFMIAIAAVIFGATAIWTAIEYFN